MNDEKALATTNQHMPAAAPEFNQEQLDLIKTQIAKGCSNEELKLFLYVAKTTGLDPLTKQIYAIKRWDSKARKEVMAIQTGIDGLRSIADRTGQYAPGEDVVYTYKADGAIEKATATVKKLVAGTWHEIKATAFFDEYKQMFKNNETGHFELSKFWKEKGHIMIAKCAEALAIRKAFPGQTANVYTPEEIREDAKPEAIEAEVVDPTPKPEPKPAPKPQAKLPMISVMDYALIDKIEVGEDRKKGTKAAKVTFGDIVMYCHEEEKIKALEEIFNKGKKIKVQFDQGGKFKKIVEFKVEE